MSRGCWIYFVAFGILSCTSLIFEVGLFGIAPLMGVDLVVARMPGVPGIAYLE